MTTGNSGTPEFETTPGRVDLPTGQPQVPAHPAVLAGTDRNSTDLDSIDLLELLVVFLAEWKIGLIAAILTTVIGVIYTFRTPPQFVAVAVILPKQSLTESANLASISSVFSGKQSEGLYTGLLRSRSVTDNVIRELNLTPQSGAGWENVRNFVQGSMTPVTGVDGLLRISVRSGDAKLAMRLANAFLDGLNQQQKTMALSQSQLNREFFEQQMDKEKQALATAEADLIATQKSLGIIEVGTQTQIGLNQIAGIRSQITGLEVQLTTLRQSETDQNPQIQTLLSQIAKLQSQERTYESNQANSPGAPTTAGRMPAANLEFDRKQRVVHYHEGLLSSLAGQYQNARLIEASSADAFQVVDYAIEPERKAYPPRSTWLLISAILGLVVGGLAMIFVLLKRRIQADVDYQRHMLAMKQNFRVRRR